ncbi:MAG: chemotaxis protein CheW [Thermodesulfovibrionales bacterium]
MSTFTIFRIGDETFGIAIERVVEILKPQKVYTIPGLPDFITGVMNVRGLVVPVIDLRRRFGVAPSGKKERIIMVRYDTERIGLLVDEIREILGLEQDEIRISPTIFRGFKTDYLSGLGKKDERIIILLNIDNLLTSDEKIQLRQSLELMEENGAGTQKKAD